MLRDYQEQAISLIRQEFAKGNKRVLLHLATGAGKTHCFSYMLKQAYSKKTKAIMVVRGRDLVEQASSRLTQEDVDHGVLMASHDLYDLSKNIQICSIDTINARGVYPQADFIVVDEAHLACSDSFKKFLENYKDKYVLAVTATPYGEADMTHLADTIVAPITIQELIDKQYLVDARYFSSPQYIDLEGIKIKKGDYDEKQLNDRMKDVKLIANIVDNYKIRGENRKALCFAVSVEHSKFIEKAFNDAGIPAKHLDAKAEREERLATIEDLKNDRIKVITNVGIFTTGVDIPFLDCIIMARPTKSYNLFMQMLGRGTRIYPGKKDFLVLDHGQTVYEHGFITMPRKIDISKKKKASGAPPIKQCPECYSIVPAAARVCAYCSHEFDVSVSDKTETLDIALEEVKNPYEKIIDKFIRVQQRMGLKPGWVFYKLCERFDKSHASKIYWGHVVPKHFPDLKK